MGRRSGLAKRSNTNNNKSGFQRSRPGRLKLDVDACTLVVTVKAPALHLGSAVVHLAESTGRALPMPKPVRGHGRCHS